MDPRPPFPFSAHDRGPAPMRRAIAAAGGSAAGAPREIETDGAALRAEINRARAGCALSAFACQACILLAAIAALGLAGSLALVQLARYEAALAACAGV